MTIETIGIVLAEPAEVGERVPRGRRFSRARLAGIAAVAAGAGLAILALRRARRAPAVGLRRVLRRRRSPRIRGRAAEFRSAAQRAFRHPERIARGNSYALGRRVLETVAVTASKSLAGRLAGAFFDAAVL
jgi:hypothetical protein